MLGGLYMLAKESASVLETCKFSGGFKERGHRIRHTTGRRVHCCWGSLENSGGGSSLLREKGKEHVLTFLVMACK